MAARHHQCKKNGHPDNCNSNGQTAKIVVVDCDQGHYGYSQCGSCGDKIPEGEYRRCPTCGCRLGEMVQSAGVGGSDFKI